LNVRTAGLAALRQQPDPAARFSISPAPMLPMFGWAQLTYIKGPICLQFRRARARRAQAIAAGARKKAQNKFVLGLMRPRGREEEDLDAV